MKRFFKNIITWPYRVIMYQLGYMMWCNTCHSIVSGGGGYIDEDNKHKFICGGCINEMRSNCTLVITDDHKVGIVSTKVEQELNWIS